MFSFVQDADEAEGDKDAMKRMFLDTEVSSFWDRVVLEPYVFSRL